MNFTVNSQTLAQELRLMNKIVPSKHALPILTHVRLEALDRLRLFATDLEVGLSSECTANVVEPGVTALPAKKLLDMCEQFPNGDVTIVQDKHHVRISSGAFKSRLQALPAADFPMQPQVEGTTITLPTQEFHTLIERVRYAIADKAGKYILDGALLKLMANGAAMVSTDAKRLSLATMAYAGAEMTVVVPTKTLDILSNFGEASIECSQGEKHLFFSSGKRMLASRTLEAAFPNYTRVIPRDNDKHINVDRLALAAALKRVLSVSEDSQAVYFAVETGALVMNASSAEVGDADERVSVAYTGDDLKVCCNGKFVLDFLEAASGQAVGMALKSGVEPMLLSDGDTFLNVVMLMSV